MSSGVISTSIVQASKRLLRVALVGAPNAGKSTLLNRLVMSNVSCVSSKVHTTRRNILAAYTKEDAQLEFYDSPGIITRSHLLKHSLEDSLLVDPREASKMCDLIAVVIDASNGREQRRLNRGVLAMLEQHRDKKSYLIMNKVDLIKEKRKLLEIGTTLSENHLEGRPLTGYTGGYDKDPESNQTDWERQRTKNSSRFVIELDKSENRSPAEAIPQAAGFRHFSQIFSISALEDDGVDELREYMLDLAMPVEQWPHGPEFLTDQSTRQIVHSIIRGQVMNSTEHELPYLVEYSYLECKYDELGSLHISLELLVPKKYMVGKLLGQHGAVILAIINESKDLISQTLACDVKLAIEVKSVPRNKK